MTRISRFPLVMGMAIALMMGSCHPTWGHGPDVALVDVKDVQGPLEDAIAAQMDEPFELKLTHHPFPVEVDLDTPLDLHIEHVAINDRRTTFTAEVHRANSNLPPLPVKGTVTTLMLVPVLKTDLNKGSVIQADQITWQNVPKNRINGGHVTTEDDLVGREVRTNRLLSGRPIRHSDVRLRPLVVKGSDVRLVYQKGSLSIETKAKAMADGNKDDWIKVLNYFSGKTISAQVNAEGLTTVEGI